MKTKGKEMANMEAVEFSHTDAIRIAIPLAFLTVALSYFITILINGSNLTFIYCFFGFPVVFVAILMICGLMKKEESEK